MIHSYQAACNAEPEYFRYPCSVAAKIESAGRARLILTPLRYSCLCQRFRNLPNAVRQIRLHCRRDAQRLVNATEIVIREVQAVRGPEVVLLLAEGVRQPVNPSPRQVAHGHADRELLAFHMRRADFLRVRIPYDWDLLRARDVRRAVPALAFRVGVVVDLGQLGEVATVG